MSPRFNRSLKNNYSWLPRGITSQIINTTSTGFCSMIASLCWDGEYIVQIIQGTVNQEIFQEFIWIISYAFKTTMKNDFSRTIINLDNASIHTALSSRKLYHYYNLNVWFMPPYSPQLACIELFFNIVKSKILSQYFDKNINFSKNSEANWIFEAIDRIKKEKLEELCILTIKQAKICI